jgi:hypothetical protein
MIKSKSYFLKADNFLQDIFDPDTRLLLAFGLARKSDVTSSRSATLIEIPSYVSYS